MPRGHQDQYAAGAEQDGMAAEGAGKNRMSDVVPARKTGGAAVFCKGDTEGVQTNLAFSTQHSALSTQQSALMQRREAQKPLKHRGAEEAEDIC
jgi:hypothetical protein